MIKRIVVDPEVKNYALAERVGQKLGIVPEFHTKEELLAEVSSMGLDEMFKRSKQTLFFTENRGSFFKKCPGSKGVVCCNYYTINSVSGCPFDCSYCILQHYIKNNPFISVFLNREKAIEEMEEFLREHDHIRVGTGELADSLALDDLLDETGFFMNAIKEKGWEKRVTFEFKTKSVTVDRLIENFKKNPELDIVVGFSMNRPEFTASEEIDTAPIKERLEAIKRVIEAGMRVAIHFDPVVMLERNLEGYRALCEMIFSSIDSDRVAWISMGGFRHTLSLTAIIKERFPRSTLLAGEMFPSDKDNKLRYLATIRRRFYRVVREEIAKHVKNPPLYLCMEKSFMWDDLSMDLRSMSKGELKEIF